MADIVNKEEQTEEKKVDGAGEEQDKPTTQPTSPEIARIQKIISERGFCSRRKAEELIQAGKVEVDGKLVTELGASFPVDCEVVVDGKKLPSKAEIDSRKYYIAVNKPLGFICSASDPQNRRLVTELVPPQYGRVYPIGRLDINSEGLVFLTNDGEFDNLMMHPSSAPAKVYEVQIDGRLTPAQLEQLRNGIVLEDGLTAPCDAIEIGCSQAPDFSGKVYGLYKITLQEGKNREVRRMMQYFGFNVVHLKRTQIGIVKLGKMRKGSYVVLPPDIVERMRRDCLMRKAHNNYKAPRKYGE